MKILKDISLKNLSTFNVEAKAKYFVEITEEEEIEELITNKEFKNNGRYVLGKGANTLFKDDFDGLVIKISILGKEILSEDDNSVLLKIGAGEDWCDLVKWSVDNNWSGLENLALIPGTAGAAPVQNIGAYGQEISNVFEYLETIDLRTGNKEVFNKDECEFGYRESIFKKEGKDKYIITSIVLKLTKVKEEIQISSSPQYNSLKEELSKIGKDSFSLKDIYNAVGNIRTEKLPSIEKFGSAGCFFTNSIVSLEQLEKVQEKFPDIPYFEMDDSKLFKIPSGWILENLGWKGKTEGDVGTWPNHALIVVNYGDCNGKDVLAFANKIMEDFFKETGIHLEPEVNII